jgi:hypothetical protein
MLSNLQNRNMIPPATVAQLQRYQWSEIQQAVNDILTPVSTSYSDLVLEEFRVLIDGSVNGIPPVRGPPPSSPVLFEMNPNKVRKIQASGDRSFRVAPVARVRTITVQTGYRREVDTQTPAQVVAVAFSDPSNPGQLWYPGVAFFGEGIFIMLEQDGGWHHGLVENAADSWKHAFEQPSGYPSYVFRSSFHEELHPVFVWWHTLSHLLIRSVSIEAGYSTASIRERVYLEVQRDSARGGVLLYATQPGSEGTLGGLIALVPYFEEVLARAFSMLQPCSADPLCIENDFTLGRYNGAACYGCLLISETSCEHRNMWLDRRVFIDNRP